MKKLNEKEMTQVAGGTTNTISRDELESHKGSPVGQYDGIEGNTYFIEVRTPYFLMIGKLVRTYEDDASIYGNTVRRHDILIIDINIDTSIYDYTYEVGQTITLNGGNCQLYEYI